MSTVVRIPQELRDFLDLPEPQSLLIRGPPGSGKTTLTLALLEAFRGEKVLVTSRVPTWEIHREFPWLGENGGRSIEIVDTSEMEHSVHHAARSLAMARDQLLVPSMGREKDDLDFLWLPPPLQEAWAKLHQDRSSLLIIDSWDALIESYLGASNDADRPVPDRGEIERLLLRRMGKARAHLVFVLEREEQTALDYLVNGVLVTARETAEERLGRWLTLLKLRGVRIENPTYPFTLEGGRFESIVPLRPYGGLRIGAPEPEPDVLPGLLWPGSAAFAAAFGRLPYGRTTLIELDPSAARSVADMLSYPIAAHVLRKGGRAIILPHSSETPGEVFHAFNGHLSKEKFLSHVRLVVPPGPGVKGEEPFAPTILPLRRAAPGAPPEDPTESEAGRFVREHASEQSPGLLVVSIQGLLSLAASMGVDISAAAAGALPAAFQAMTRGAAVHSIVVARRGNDLAEQLRSIATVRIEVSIRQGRVFLRGLAPWTPNFVLIEGSATKPYDLLKVV